MTNLNASPKRWRAGFPLGRIVMTDGASQALSPHDIATALLRHARGDWGEVCSPDWEVNGRALEGGGRLLSAYHDRRGVRFWIVTEADRSATTVLLPDDY